MLYQYRDPLHAPNADDHGRGARRHRIPAYAAAFLIGVVTTTWFLGRESLESLTRECLDAAQTRWSRSGMRDYDLHVRLQAAEYEVLVRTGLVTEVQSNGRETPSATWRNYSVDGLFETLNQELDNLSDASGPFAGSSSAMIARVRFHPTLGYPERYLRSGGPMGKTAVIEVLRFRPLSSPG